MILHKNITGDELHDPKSHAEKHQNSGSDEINVAGLSGVLADKQDPRFDSTDFVPNPQLGDLISLLYELPVIISTLENKISILAQEVKRCNTDFDLNNIF